MLSAREFRLFFGVGGPFVFATDYEEPYSSQIRMLAQSCSQPFVCSPRWASGGLTNRVWFSNALSSCGPRIGLVLCFSGSREVLLEARSLKVPVTGCFSEDPLVGLAGAAYFSTLIRGIRTHRT